MDDFTLFARLDASEEFTREEVEMLIDASLTGNGYEQAANLLRNKYNGYGYISGYEIEDAAYGLDPEKYGNGGFSDIEF